MSLMVAGFQTYADALVVLGFVVINLTAISLRRSS